VQKHYGNSSKSNSHSSIATVFALNGVEPTLEGQLAPRQQHAATERNRLQQATGISTRASVSSIRLEVPLLLVPP